MFSRPYPPLDALNNLKVVIGMAVTVVYQGTFEKEGYRLGRLAAGLYRMPPLSPRDKEEGTIEAEDYDLPQVIYI